MGSQPPDTVFERLLAPVVPLLAQLPEPIYESVAAAFAVASPFLRLAEAEAVSQAEDAALARSAALDAQDREAAVVAALDGLVTRTDPENLRDIAGLLEELESGGT